MLYLCPFANLNISFKNHILQLWWLLSITFKTLFRTYFDAFIDRCRGLSLSAKIRLNCEYGHLFWRSFFVAKNDERIWFEVKKNVTET